MLFRSKLTEKELIEQIKPFVPAEWLKNEPYFKKVLALDKERIKRLDDARYIMEIFFETPKVEKELLTKKDDLATIKQWLNRVTEIINKTDMTHDAIENALRKLADELDVQSGRLFYALRVGLTGRTEAPGLFDIFVTLGKEESLKRLKSI